MPEIINTKSSISSLDIFVNIYRNYIFMAYLLCYPYKKEDVWKQERELHISGHKRIIL